MLYGDGARCEFIERVDADDVEDACQFGRIGADVTVGEEWLRASIK